MLDSIIKSDAITVGDVVVPLVLAVDREIGANRQQFARFVVCHHAEQRLRVRRPGGRGLVPARQIGHHVHGGTFGIEIMVRSDLGIRGPVIHHVLVISLPERLAVPYGRQRGLILHGQIRSASENENV